jgi:hypothetical protein
MPLPPASPLEPSLGPASIKTDLLVTVHPPPGW